MALGSWRLDDEGRLLLDGDIDVGNRVFPVTLRYPQSFPHSPPSVLPRDAAERWSGHQFGSGGELCLEYRSDNWTPDVMGYQMLESAHRLLAGENPAPDEHAVVGSAHLASQGQLLRGKVSRLLVTRLTQAFFDEVTIGSSIPARAVVQFSSKNIVYLISQTKPADGSAWVDISIPSDVRSDPIQIAAAIVRLPDDAHPPSAVSRTIFMEQMAIYGWDPEDVLVVVLIAGRVHAFRVFDDSISPVVIVPPAVDAARLSEGYSALSGLRVAVVGCGSLGSKIATMLARSGVGSFFLVDDDLFLPDNLVRHDLDWREAGLHKADALAQRLFRVRSSVEVQTRLQQLGGQDSSSAAEGILTSLVECDLLIDATANPVATNLLAGLVASVPISVVWAEVFAGGIGGLVARCRPGKEPTIPQMRRAIENWFGERGTPPVRTAGRYDSDGDRQPLVADDADVTAIAAPAARLALDCLLGREPSHYPQSIYVIGLAPSAVFDEPFETHPIALPEVPAESAPSRLDDDAVYAELEVLQNLFERRAQS